MTGEYLDKFVSKSGNFNQIAELAQIDKQKLYRWYHDTHQRRLSPQLTYQDKVIIESQVLLAMERGTSLNRQFQFKIKQLLSQTYHRNTFTIFFNNAVQRCKKCIQSAASDCSIPSFIAFEVILEEQAV